MKRSSLKIAAASLIMLSAFSCKKGEGNAENITSEKSAAISAGSKAADSISYAASQTVPDKKFVKTADIDMEVKDVYDATIFIEKQLKDLGGFVTESRLNSNVVSEDTYETSDAEATLVKKYQAENRMQVRVPSEKLAEFLTFINDKKLFLNFRIIMAKDVTDNARIAKLEQDKLQKTGEVIAKMKDNGEKVEKTEANLADANVQQVENLKLADDLKYSTVDIYIKEPKVRVAEIPVANTKNIENKYRFNFFYELKNAFVEGFYTVQRLILGLAALWPLLLLGAAAAYLLRLRRRAAAKNLE